MEPLPDQIGAFLARGASVAATQGGANLHRWMGALGLERWMGAASLAGFLVLGVWLRVHRRANPWLLLAVTALVARLWTYHRMYDDLLILVPMAALFPLAGDGAAGSGTRRTAGILFLLGWVGLEAPGTLARLPFPWNLPYEVAQPAIWLSMLAFLGRRARAGASPEGSRRLSSEPPPPAIRGGVGKV
jgi:hypothetical protein